MHKYIKLIAAFLMMTTALMGQQMNGAGTESTSLMESEGKIYVVMIVCLVILAGLIGYLFMLDRRITKMEQNKD
jgi:heme/copper-type cytochrome/quinol oxidase subunit 2